MATSYEIMLNLNSNPAPNADQFEQHGVFTDNNSIQSAFDLRVCQCAIAGTLVGNVGFLNGVGGALDSADYYRFTVAAGTTVSGTVTLAGLEDDADVIVFGPGNTFISNVKSHKPTSETLLNH